MRHEDVHFEKKKFLTNSGRKKSAPSQRDPSAKIVLAKILHQNDSKRLYVVSLHCWRCGINLIPFFNICSVLALLSPRLFVYVLLYFGRCAIATVAVCGFGSWSFVFHCGLPRQISPLPPTPSQTEVCSTMGESIRPSSFHNPTLSANNHFVQICRSSLSAAVQTVQVSVEPRLSTALKDRSVVP